MTEKRTDKLKLYAKKTALLAMLAQSVFVGSEVMAAEDPKLVVMITIDQLRGDMPQKYYDRFGEGGFKYLMDKGTI